MKAQTQTAFLVAVLLSAAAAQAGQEVDRLLKEYSRIETVTCQIRRVKEGAAGKMTFLSRVYYTNKDRLHAEGITPIKRRTIADGVRLYQYAEGDPKGFSRPVGELSEQMTISLRMVPGTPMDHLLQLKGKAEQPLPPDSDAARRIGIVTDRHFVVLLFDATDRLNGIDFYKTPAMEARQAEYRYSDLTEVVPGVWVPFTHKARILAGETDFTETVRVDRFIANQPVAESLFIPASFFDKGIDFVDEFAKIYPE